MLTKKRITTQPNVKKSSEVVKIIPLGGLEEVGRNMTLLEYQNQILIIDMGLQFPDDNMPGIDFIIPNIDYLFTHPEKTILGIFITHAHYDHIGAIPYLIEKLNYPPLYATPLAKAIILKRQEDFPHLHKLEINEVKINNHHPYQLGPFSIKTFHLNHSIPETIGLAINTPVGLIMYATDFKFDFHPLSDQPANLPYIANLASSGVSLLLSDSTRADTPGHSLSEKVIMENLEKIFLKAKGRIFLATFASLISRLQEAIWLAEKYNRKVAIEGRTMQTDFKIAQRLGYIKVERGTLISVKESRHLDPRRVLILCTGAQGEPEAVLIKLANREHKHLRLEKGDTVIFSSSIVPGNELAVQNLKDNLSKQGADVYHYKMLDIHTSGHGHQDDLKLMLGLTRPRFFMPIHGYYSLLKEHAKIAESMGIPPSQIIVASNGQVVELTRENIFLTQKFVPTNYVMVDGLGVGDIEEVVLRDRQALAQDGIFIIIALVDKKTGLLHNEAEIISRGFVYMKESKELVRQTKKMVQEIISRCTKGQPFNAVYIRNTLRDEIGLFLFKKTKRRPMILPVVIEV